MSAELPQAVARCRPHCACPQAQRCARYLADPFEDEQAIDGSRALTRRGCALFIDQRGSALFPRLVVTAPPRLSRPATWLDAMRAAA